MKPNKINIVNEINEPERIEIKVAPLFPIISWNEIEPIIWEIGINTWDNVEIISWDDIEL